MPYQKEFATNKGNQTLMASSGIKEMLKVVQYIISDTEYKRLDNYVVSDKKITKPEDIKYVFVFDGSKFETEVTEGSEAKLCLFHINQCVINMDKMLSYLKNPFPFPKEYKQIKQDITLSSFLPIKGMTTIEQKDEKDFFRFSLYSILKDVKNPIVDWLKQNKEENKNNIEFKNEETILETYLHLLSRMETIKNAPHPCPDCRKLGRGMSLKSFRNEDGSLLSEIQCKCNLNPKTIYPTDFLGFHEQLNNETSNEGLTTQIMLVMERLTLINMLRNMINNNYENLLNDSVFMMDGSLAIYFHASWLSEAINKELVDIKDKYPLLLIGIEKTGSFVEHFKKVNNHFNVDSLKNGMLFFLEDEYIKKYVKVYDNAGFYGENNYFGKKLYYKNKNGKLFVVNVAFENEADRSVYLNNRNNNDYRDGVTRLEDIVMLLDNFASQSYENALSLISMANEGVALSSSQQGKKLLNEFVKTMIEIKK